MISEKYQILDQISESRIAQVWLAKQVGLEGFAKLVVIKKMLPGPAQDEKSVNQFLDEAKLAAQLNHPNIIQIYDLGRGKNSFYIAMEYIPGHDVRDIFEKGYLPLELSANIISQAADGLHHAHTLANMYGEPMSIVHRNISPENIRVTYGGTVKVVDFGIAKAAQRAQNTSTGILKGNLSYMSPEQVSREPLNGRSDIFSLGILLYEMTLGKRLFKGRNDFDILQKITREPITPPIELHPKFPRKLSHIIMKALEKEPENRYQTAREFHLALKEFINQYEKPATNIDLAAWMREYFSDEMKYIQIRHEKLLRGQEVSRMVQHPGNKKAPFLSGKSGTFLFDDIWGQMTFIQTSPLQNDDEDDQETAIEVMEIDDDMIIEDIPDDEPDLPAPVSEETHPTDDPFDFDDFDDFDDTFVDPPN